MKMKVITLALLCFFSLGVLADEPKYMPNFKEAELSMFVEVMSKYIEHEVVIDDAISGDTPISARSYTLMSRDEMFGFFVASLSSEGFMLRELEGERYMVESVE
mgnify:CR=1 FL=1|tara:strand:- start:30218 stop:30529 length:312 start_codon:yes stop_codon:yes gene_type:complete